MIVAVLVVVGVALVFWLGLVQRDVHIWLAGYVRHRLRVRRLRRDVPVTHVMFFFTDHFEPLAGGVDMQRALERVARWRREYPRLAGRHRDADGRPPVHSFFYPEEEYRPELLDGVAEICRGGFGEVEVHLHHDHDTEAGLREKLNRFLRTLDQRHGLVPLVDGAYRYGFIHGNWALDNSRRDGRWCGINNELSILRDTGCYADFTLPSAPSDTQTRTINAIYYATDDPAQAKSHDTGVPMRVGGQASGDLLIFQGPLTLNWRHRRFGIWPRIENADIAPCDMPIEERVDLWVRQHIHVQGRPEWLFIKVHTHGAVEENADFLFGGELERMFSCLESRFNSGAYRLHYVSAREAFNIAKAAEAGCTGDPGRYRDYAIPPPAGQRAALAPGEAASS